MGNALLIEHAGFGRPLPLQQRRWPKLAREVGPSAQFSAAGAAGHGCPPSPDDLFQAAWELALGDTGPCPGLLWSASDSVRRRVATSETVFDSLRALWDDDEISTIDLGLALCRLLTAFRQATARQAAVAGTQALSRVLVASAPGEPHFQQAVMAADLLRQDGHDVTLALGQDEDALFRIRAACDCEQVVVATSPVFDRWDAQRVAALAPLSALNPGRGVILLERFSFAPVDVLDRAGFGQYCVSALELPALLSARPRIRALHGDGVLRGSAA